MNKQGDKGCSDCGCIEKLRDTGLCSKCEQKMFDIMAGMDEVNMKMAERMYKDAPICHFRLMMPEREDAMDNYYHGKPYWECSVCGHTKNR